MTKLASALSTGQALILAVVVVGCATAAVITGHISGGDFLGILGGVGLTGGVVTTAHVVGTQVNTAAGSTTTTPAPTGGNQNVGPAV